MQHPKKATELIETAEPDERLDHFYRFKLVVPAGQVVKFVVKCVTKPSKSGPHFLLLFC
jgi:hypothetical protein